MVIALAMANFNGHRAFVDKGSSVNVIFKDVFETLQLHPVRLATYGFGDVGIISMGTTSLMTTFDQEPPAAKIQINFMVDVCLSAYNLLIRQSIFAKPDVIVSYNRLVSSSSEAGLSK